MKNTSIWCLSSVFIALALVSCGGSASSPETATVSIGITDNSDGYESVVLTIEEIGIVTSGTATTYFGADVIDVLPVVIDVLDYPAEKTFHFGDIMVPLPENGQPLCFNQIRFVLASEGDVDCTGPFCNYVIEAGETEAQLLTTPSGQQSGIKLLTPNQFCADPGQTEVQIALDFDPATAIIYQEKKDKFQLKPTGIRIIEGDWTTAPADYIEGVVHIPADSNTDGCIPFATTPLVTIEGEEASDPPGSVATTATLADELTADCFYAGRYKLLLPAAGTYDVSAFWDDFSGSAAAVISGTSGVDLLLSQ